LRRIALVIAYNGAHFCGWQRQPQQPSVQQTIEEALAKITGTFTNIAASGRTDSGVHAQGQVAAFNTVNLTIKANQFAYALNAYLPSDIRILKSLDIPLNFDARRHAIRRVYRYNLTYGCFTLPSERPNIYTLSYPPNLAKLNKLASVLVGSHNFSAFCSSADNNINKVRTLYRSVFVPQGNKVVYHIEGNAFLMNMVRIIVGTLLTLRNNPQAIALLQASLKYGQRQFNSNTAPAHGLSLQKVVYPESYSQYGL
jgi:tRNA pseudouridine38-40 synthase